MDEQTARRRRAAALTGLTVGLIIALVANLAYAVPRGAVSIGLGVVAPLVLPLTLYLRTTFETDQTWQTWVREISTLAVAGPAAAISYVHTYSLVLDAGEPWILAILAPLSSDGLAGMATLALHRQQQQAAQIAVAPSRVGASSRRANETAPPLAPPVVAVEVVEPVRDLRAGSSVRDRVRTEYLRTARDVLARGESLDDIVLAQVDTRAGASKGYAKKFAPTWRAELETEQVTEAVG